MAISHGQQPERVLEVRRGVTFARGFVMRSSDRTAFKKVLDATIKRPTAMRDGLRHAVNCNAPNHSESPKFPRIVDVVFGDRACVRVEQPCRDR